MTGGEAAPTAEIAKQVRVVLAQNVRWAREQAGMTQEDLANASGVARETIARLEQGDREPRLLTLVAFSLGAEPPAGNAAERHPGIVDQLPVLRSKWVHYVPFCLCRKCHLTLGASSDRLPTRIIGTTRVFGRASFH